MFRVRVAELEAAARSDCSSVLNSVLFGTIKIAESKQSPCWKSSLEVPSSSILLKAERAAKSDQAAQSLVRRSFETTYVVAQLHFLFIS